MSTIQLIKEQQKSKLEKMKIKLETECHSPSITKLQDSKVRAEDLVGLTWIFVDELEMMNLQKNFSSVIPK